MSLAWRILLLALLLNALTVGSVQVAVFLAQQHWLQNRHDEVKAQVQSSFGELERVYSPTAVREASGNAAIVRRLLTAASTRELYDDVIVTSGLPSYEGVYLNPLGAVHRDPDEFPAAVITAGMVQARQANGMLMVSCSGTAVIWMVSLAMVAP